MLLGLAPAVRGDLPAPEEAGDLDQASTEAEEPTDTEVAK